MDKEEIGFKISSILNSLCRIIGKRMGGKMVMSWVILMEGEGMDEMPEGGVAIGEDLTPEETMKVAFWLNNSLHEVVECEDEGEDLLNNQK